MPKTENTRWYAMSSLDALDALKTDPDVGLSEEEAAARLAAHGENDVFPIRPATFASTAKKVALDPLLILMLLVSALSAIFGGWQTFVILLSAALVNYLVLTITYNKAEQVFVKTSVESLPSATVIRAGRVSTVPIKDLVPGDIILVSEGQIVPADARLIECDRLSVLESGVTAAAGAVRKSADQYDARVREPHECQNMIYAVTIVVCGKARAVVCETGANTLACRKSKRSAPSSFARPPVIKNLEKLSYIVGLALVLAAALLTLLNLVLRNYGALDGFILALAFAASFMCESYALLGGLAIAVGVFGTLDKNRRTGGGCLIKNTAGLEELKDVTTLLVPCESVFSEKHIRLDKLYVHGRMLDFASGGLTDDERDKLDKEEQVYRVREKQVLIVQALISTGNYTARRVNLKNQRGDVYTYEQNAIIDAATDAGLYNVSLDEKYPIIGHAGVDEAPFETTLISWYGENRLFLRGDVSKVLDCCTHYATGIDGTTERLSVSVRNNLETVARQMMRQNKRVVAVASGASRYRTLIKTGDLYRGLVFEGLIGFEEPVLPGAAHYVRRCRDAGIRTVLFADEDNEKNRQLAYSLGIVREGCPSDLVISAQSAEKMGSEMFRLDISKYNMLCGFDLRERRKIIDYLRARGEKIAYLALDTAELPLARAASVAVTRVTSIDSGRVDGRSLREEQCDALRFSADVLVSPVAPDGSGGYNALVNAVAAAKNIYKNLGSALSYLAFTAGARLLLFALSFFSFLGFSYVNAAALAVCGLVVDLVAVFAIIFAPPEKNALSYRAPRGAFAASGKRLLICSAAGVLYAAISVGSALLFSFAVGGALSPSAASALPFVSLVAAAPALAFESKKVGPSFSGSVSVGGMDGILFLVAAALVILALVIPPFGTALGVSAVSIPLALSALLPVVALVVACELVKLALKSKR